MNRDLDDPTFKTMRLQLMKYTTQISTQGILDFHLIKNQIEG